MLSRQMKSYLRNMNTSNSSAVSWFIVSLLCGFTLQANANQIVKVNTVYQSETSASYKAVGHIKAKEFARLAAAESGLVTAVAANSGDDVARGEVLISLDGARLEALVAKQKSEVVRQQHIVYQMETIFSDIKSDFEALRSTEVGGAVSQQMLRNTEAKMISSKNEYEAAKALLSSYQSELSLLEIRFSDSVIRAPFDGRVTERFAQLGEWLSVGESAIAMYSSNYLEAWVEVPERFALNSDQIMSQPITLRIGELSLESQQIRIVKSIDKSSGAFYLVAQLPTEAADLFPGMNLTAWVNYGARKSFLFVPQSAIVKNHLGTLVYKVERMPSEEGSVRQAKPLAVEPLFQKGNFVALAPDHQLQQGDQVVVEGNLRLLSNSPVTVIETLTLKHAHKM
ncbi:Multidrug resistance protein MdtA [Pseudoalteromonas holothuriae]|uniref:Multidrug resistance protein MdtA n=1 Tax=Pseudoalteromonas holothuriae TaxID=2963714 RepID=A0ABN8UKG0_9GAMM|nr:efflux RND transporter periplasmic adaptor subunit [Pseudoalteromonas sp. CIP111951]CAH9057887.1 Multidrug resistance protein MdtA [Pseudoalteromonas sp. CIP111951]